jgi:hypothetical protein
MGDSAIERIERFLDGLVVADAWMAKQRWRLGIQDAAKVDSANPTRRVAIAIVLFDDVLGKTGPPDLYLDWGFHRELYFVSVVRAVDFAFRSFEDACLRPGFEPDEIIRHTATYLRNVFDAIVVKDWGWGAVLGPDGLEYVASRLETRHGAWDEFATRTVRTYAEIQIARGKMCESHVFEALCLAKRRGLERLPIRNDLDRAGRLIDRTRLRWRRQLTFGTKHPDKTDQQYEDWHKGWRNVRDRIPDEQPIETPDEARDRFCFEQISNNASDAEISNRVNEQAGARGWGQLSPSGVRDRARAHAVRIGKPVPLRPRGPKRKSDRVG